MYTYGAARIPTVQRARTGGLQNPLPAFSTVKDDGQLGNVQSIAKFFTAAAAGTLPAVSWVIPSGVVSDHPPYSIRDGQAHVTSVINAVMNGPNWDHCAIFLS
jgi:phospholipase C